ncbi:hypothetical protein FO440_23620 [Mucilaginibacter corticis]|uniref:FAD-dependent urate hydroxylase HpyO/Asp monooxygenase CreE-like FAD/NAD(P)-binding domain-containing protein n=1 Tax=Mucilaginibacter corticis TaxID=2597670 RepID=A0A556M7M0_9SPHI|nr:FAD/NAD(P)-binding protein [Mucilaginibacter corticis]TSJ35912.1 hypothetical protein FO440_23620 [Mucilaginibacter corticis]
MEIKKRVAILGGGPSGLFMFKRLVESGDTDFVVTVFERKNRLGAGMPYSAEGACDEHITNVSGNEIPELVTALDQWVQHVPKDTLDKYHLEAKRFNEFKVLPRLLFGQYLTAQFDLLQKRAKEIGLEFTVYYNTEVTDVIDRGNTVLVEVDGSEKFEFDHVVICTGHNWPKKHEGMIPGFFDSPYPPSKLGLQLNHAVAITGSSLTAVDAIRTLARHNGTFVKKEDGELNYELSAESPEFKMVLHTRNGMLPAVRFHLDDSHLENDSLLSDEEIKAHIKANGGFLSLDYIFEKDFKLPIQEKEPEFYEQIKDMRMEEFVAAMMDLREKLDPFQLLKAEYAEAAKSIKRKKSIYWKEMLGVLSFALNYPAKHLSAEDMQRLQKTLTPLISIVIAYIPQSSSEELLALHAAGVLELIPVGEDSEVEPVASGGAIYHYDNRHVFFQTYINCTGQPHLKFEEFPFKSLIKDRTITPAKLKYKDPNIGLKDQQQGLAVTQDDHGDYYLRVPGITINDNFQVADAYGALNDRIYVMAVPYIGGYNPDYSGLDFSEEASAIIIKSLRA